MNVQTLIPEGKVTVSKKPFKMMCFEKEKNRSLVSFVLAVAVHLIFLFAGNFTFVQAADYGIEGSSASIDVYMVAALPDSVREI